MFFSLACYATGFVKDGDGLQPSAFLQSGSYQEKFLSLEENQFPIFPAYIITQSDDFPGAQQQLITTLQLLQTSSYVASVPILSTTYWLNNFLTFINSTNPAPVSSTSFYPDIGPWLSSFGAVYAHDLYCIDITSNSQVSCTSMYDTSNNTLNSNIVIKAALGQYYLYDLETIDNILEAMRSTRGQLNTANAEYSNSNNPNYWTFTMSYVRYYYDQYLHWNYDLYFTVGMVWLGVGVLTLLLTFSPLMAIIMFAFLAMVSIEVYGLLP